MFEKIKNILSKKAEPAKAETITFEELPVWLENQEKDCITRRAGAIKTSRERIITFKQDLRQLLTEFGQETSDEPHHHKVEQVNRHALPQFCKKIESELEGGFSDDDEEFYQEVAGLMNGCFKAFKGPGKYLHHLYPEEIKEFRHTLDNTGHELNRMTEIIRLSREYLSNLAEIRDELENRHEMEEELRQAGVEKDKYESSLLDLNNNLESLQSDLARLSTSVEYQEYSQLEEDIQKAETEFKQSMEVYESHIRNAIPVWKRAGKLFQEQGNAEHEKLMDDVVHIAQSPRRQDDEIVHKVKVSSKELFSLIGKGLLQTKNTFEKHLFTNPEEYSEKFSQSLQSIRNISDNLECKKQERENNSVNEKIRELKHLIEHAEHEIRQAEDEESRRIERMSTMEENLSNSLTTIREKFDRCSKDKARLLIPGEME